VCSRNAVVVLLSNSCSGFVAVLVLVLVLFFFVALQGTYLVMVGYDLSMPPPQQKPAWLEALLSEKFFVPCTKHAALKKNERNVFCVDCNGGVCQHCVHSHQSHCLLQIRRYVYHDVIRLQDIQRLLDCSQVQTYIINSARVVFLNQRPQPRPAKGLGNACGTCDRSLQDSYSFCSVACKVDAVILLRSQGRGRGGGDTIIKDFLPFSSSSFACLQAAGSSLLKAEKQQLELEEEEQLLQEEEEAEEDSPFDDIPTQTSSNRTGSDGVGCGTIISTASTHMMMPKKIRSGRLSTLATSPKSVLLPVSVNRRKGIPHRSPCC
jgi:hypothetical protein